jgi:hypothetical protein
VGGTVLLFVPEQRHMHESEGIDSPGKSHLLPESLLLFQFVELDLVNFQNPSGQSPLLRLIMLSRLLSHCCLGTREFGSTRRIYGVFTILQMKNFFQRAHSAIRENSIGLDEEAAHLTLPSFVYFASSHSRTRTLKVLGLEITD